jgi:hypothetical protein
VRGIAGCAGAARAVLAVAFVLLHASLLCAGSGELRVMPPPGAPNRSGLEVAVDTQWVDGSGYRWVRVHVSTVGNIASPRDRLLRIEIAPNSSRTSDRAQVARGFVELKQGASKASAGLLVPQSSPWHWLAVAVYEGGTLRPELSSSANHGSAQRGWSESIPSILVIDRDAPTALQRSRLLDRYSRNPNIFTTALPALPDVRGLRSLVMQAEYQTYVGDRPPLEIETLNELSAAARLELLPPGDLPDRWPGFSCVDVIVVSLDDLSFMNANHREQLDALLAWCAAGGHLVVYGVGENYAKLHELESLCKLAPLTRRGDFQVAGWKAASLEKQNNRPVQTIQSVPTDDYNFERGPTPTDHDPARVVDQRDLFGSKENPRFLVRSLSMGKLVAMPMADPFPGATFAWSWLLNHFDERPEEHRWLWPVRHGLSLQGANHDFWEFLVPGTGKAPVWPFCVLITLFAILIGPVNYFVLQRQKRLYLMLITIPLGAALVTFGLFAYAVVTDGLSTRLRTRSYTHLDQRTGRAVNWSRQSYYASVAPAGGLSFPEDAAVYPFEQYPVNSDYDRWERQRVYAWDDGQHFQSGYMSSRVTSQFLVVHSRPSTASIVFSQTHGPKQATNKLGAKVEYLLVRDQDGNYFFAENAADGATFALTPTDFAKQKNALIRRMLTNRPELPPGFDPNQLSGLWRRYGPYAYRNNAGDSETGLLERGLERILNAQKDTMHAGSYIAIVDKSPEVPIGIEGARQEASFHVVEGNF